MALKRRRIAGLKVSTVGATCQRASKPFQTRKIGRLTSLKALCRRAFRHFVYL